MQLYSRNLLGFIASFTAAELASLAGFLNPGVGHLMALGIAGVALALAVVNLRWAVYLLLGELFVGGKGYLFSLPLGQSGGLSIRMALFLIVIGVGLSHFLLRIRPDPKKILRPSNDNLWILAFAATFVFGIINGLTHHPFARVFFDANGWMFFLLLPVFMQKLKDPTVPIRLVQLLAAAVVVLAAKSAALVYLFGHVSADALLPVYQWIRDTGVGEITHVSGPLFRVFFQSHLYSLIGFLVVLTLICHRSLRRGTDLVFSGALLYLASLTLLISQSRSLWVGWAAGTALLLGHLVSRRTLTVTRAVLSIGALVAVVTSQLTVVNLLAGNAGGNIIANRFADLGLEPASSTRKSQLPPLLTAIQRHPWLGSGFGQSVTYQSFDPRVRREHPGGWYTTTAFEWGYHDIALKIGLLGLTVYAAWLARVVWQGLAMRLVPPAPWLAASVIGLVGIAATSVFSPYLNHPLGIGWVMVTMAAVQAGKQINGKQTALNKNDS